MRLSDAVEELEGLEGAQTHRSWWVARDAVRGVERGDGRAIPPRAARRLDRCPRYCGHGSGLPPRRRRWRASLGVGVFARGEAKHFTL